MAHVTFIHGIANKPPADRLLSIWRRALANEDGLDLGNKGVTSTMVYWADVLYARPSQDADAHESTGPDIVVEDNDDDSSWRNELTGAEKEFVDRLAARLAFDAESPAGENYEAPEADNDGSFERIPIPWSIKRRIMKKLLKDVHHYLFNTKFSPRPGEHYQVQDEIRNRFVGALKQAQKADSGSPHIVVSHSMGTVIAYDCLKHVADCPSIDHLMTIGCPLGIDEVQDLLPEWTRNDGFPSKKLQGSWVNVFDRLDPVALDTHLANDYRKDKQKVVQDINEQNWGKWRHSIDKYLAGDKLRTALTGQLGL